MPAGAKEVLIKKLCVHEKARLDPTAHQIQLRDFLTPTGDSDPEVQAPPNKMYKDTFKMVDKFNARAALVPVGWRIREEKARWLLGLFQVALNNAYALYKNNCVLEGVEERDLLPMREFVAQVGEAVYHGNV